MLRFQLRTASSLRSMARFSGFSALKPKAPRIGQMCAWLKRTPCMRSMTAPTHLRVHSSVPKPCSVGLCRTAFRTEVNCPASSLPGRPGSGTARNASMPPSSNRAFHVYTVCRATPKEIAFDRKLLRLVMEYGADTTLRLPINGMTYEEYAEQEGIGKELQRLKKLYSPHTAESR